MMMMMMMMMMIVMMMMLFQYLRLIFQKQEREGFRQKKIGEGEMFNFNLNIP